MRSLLQRQRQLKKIRRVNNMGTINKGKVTFTEAASEAKFGYIKGEAKWAELLAPGLYGTYGIKLYGDEVVEMKEELEAMSDSAYDEVIELGKKANKADVLKQDDDGNYFLGFKLKETKFDGTPNKVTMYDAGGNKVDDWDKLVGNGSVVKVKYRIAPYYMSSTKMVGISYSFYAVQVINLVEFSQGDSGFGDETDGAAPFDTDTPSEDF